MIRINIRTYNLITVKFFENISELSHYLLTDILFMDMDPGNPNYAINKANKLARDLYDTFVGQSITTEYGHIISVAGKSRPVNYLNV